MELLFCGWDFVTAALSERLETVVLTLDESTSFIGDVGESLEESVSLSLVRFLRSREPRLGMDNSFPMVI